MVAFFEMVQSFLQGISNGLETALTFVLQFLQIATGGISLFINLMSPFPFLITCMVMAVIVIAIIKLILSLVGVII